MLVSVVIGALNEEKYIARTLSSLKAQKTSHRLEIIVGDGCSEDRTRKIAKKLGAKVVKEKNRSAAWERQAGAKIAKGEIIAFTDADADVPSEWIEIIGREFVEDASIAMVYGPVYLSDSSGFERSVSGLGMDLYLSSMALLGFHNPIGSNLAVRGSLFEKIGGFDTSLVTAEDIDLSKRISALGKVKFVREMRMNVSARRVRKWGYLYYIFFHLINAMRFRLTGKARRDYSPVR